MGESPCDGGGEKQRHDDDVEQCQICLLGRGDSSFLFRHFYGSVLAARFQLLGFQTLFSNVNRETGALAMAAQKMQNRNRGARVSLGSPRRRPPAHAAIDES